jgi:hypothetical protein
MRPRSSEERLTPAVPESVVLDRDLQVGIGEVDPCDEALLVEHAELCYGIRQAGSSQEESQPGLLGGLGGPVGEVGHAPRLRAALAPRELLDGGPHVVQPDHSREAQPVQQDNGLVGAAPPDQVDGGVHAARTQPPAAAHEVLAARQGADPDARAGAPSAARR